MREAGTGGTLRQGRALRETVLMFSLTVEHIFSVAGPDLVVRLLVGKGAGSGGIAGNHMEASVSQLVKRLLQKGELEIVAGCVALRGAVGVAALVQRLPKHLFSQGGLSADHNPCDPAEFGVGVAVATQSIRASVANGDEARSLAVHAPWHQPGTGSTTGTQAVGRVSPWGRVLRVALTTIVTQRVLLADLRSQQLHELWKVEKLGLPLQTPPFREVVWKNHLLVAHVVKDVPEQKTITVHEEATLCVSGQSFG